MNAHSVSTTRKPWREILSADRPWRERAADVEQIVRHTLAAVPPETVWSTTELVEHLFPRGDSADEGARAELFNRLSKLAAHVPGICRRVPAIGKGPNAGKAIMRALWVRLDPEFLRTPPAMATVPAGDLAARLDAIEARLAKLEG